MKQHTRMYCIVMRLCVTLHEQIILYQLVAKNSLVCCISK